MSKMEGKTNFSRRLKQFDGLIRLTQTPSPLFYDRSTPLMSVGEKLERSGFRVWVQASYSLPSGPKSEVTAFD